MKPSRRRPPASQRPARLSRHLTLSGSRGDALEHLPVFRAGERLELAAGRISLVGARSRVDVSIVAETGVEADDRHAPLLLLELAFEGGSEREVDAFVRRYRHRAHLACRCQ